MNSNLKSFLKFLGSFCILLLILSCNSSKSVDSEIDKRLATAIGDGNVNRSALTYAFLMEGSKDTIVDFSNFAIPDDAAFPSNIFEGSLILHNLKTSGQYQELKETSGNSVLEDRKYLPDFNFEFVQSGSHIIPLKRGYQANNHPYWEYILEPGRVWDEINDKGYSRAAIPFTLKQKNHNCLHNGVLMFLFKDDGSVSNVVYQVASETCAYFQVDMWGTVEASYTPTSVKSKEKYIQEYVSEVTGRIPSKPISELSKDYPGAQPEQFSGPTEAKPEHLTVYGYLIDGVNYIGGCETRYGTYPYCEVLNVPSYSSAKSISAGMGLMRMEKLYPGTRKAIIASLIQPCDENGNWDDVTIENALDMATGNYEVLKPMADEGGRHNRNFFQPLTHKEKLDLSCTYYSRKTEPGTEWVYHTTDTYIVGTALNSVLKAKQDDPKADYFRDLLAEDIFKPLKMSPTSQKQQTTYDSAAQPFSGFGLFFQPDDAAKIGQFFIDGAKINGEEMLDPKMYSEVMNANEETTLQAHRNHLRYDKGFWFIDIDKTEFSEICSDKRLIPYVAGYGGIKIMLLPNNTVFYYFSDNFDNIWSEPILEANRIRPFCKDAP